MDTITIDSLEGLPLAAKMILPYFDSHKVVAFYGHMGAGKTTLIRELALQMGVGDTVTSPTFALINQYHSPSHGTIFHFDFYRIDKIEEAFDLGYEEYFYSGELCLIEWPEKIESLLPSDMLRIEITTSPDNTNSRIITVTTPD